VGRLLAAVAVVAVVAGCGGSHHAAQTTTLRQLHQFRVVFPEGFTRAQMAARVQAVAKIDRKTTSAALVRAQLAAFQNNFGNVDMAYAESKNLTPYDVLTIASMIEREAAVPSERKLIAAVIYNRLHAHMPLGIDATIRYGLHVPATKSLLQSELDSNNPYNTRKFLGLPPTPIANPGIASIEAAANPAHVGYLYFVRKPDHLHHYFTSNYNDFVNHQRQYGY
jgi:uncharacterized YceG family protein